MRFLIEPLLQPAAVAELKGSLSSGQACWEPGALTAGRQARASKNNWQLDRATPLFEQLQLQEVEAMLEHPLLRSAAPIYRSPSFSPSRTNTKVVNSPLVGAISSGNFARLAVAAGVVRLSASFTPTLSDVTLAFSGPCQPELLRFHLIRHHLAADAHRLLLCSLLLRLIHPWSNTGSATTSLVPARRPEDLLLKRRSGRDCAAERARWVPARWPG